MSGMNVRLLVAATLVLSASVAFACNKSSDASTSSGTVNVSGKREVDVTADDKGFHPSSVELKKGEAAVLVFKRTSDDTCAKQVVFPDLHVTKDLPLNQPVAFEPPVGDARTLTFQCGMGMFKGKVVVQ